MSLLQRRAVARTLRSILRAAFVIATTVAAEPSQSANRNALRDIVQEQCLPHWLQQKDPAPCERVYLTGQPGSDGYAVLADIKGGAHFLLISVHTITGIESPEILGSQALNYFAAAWQARDRLAAVLGHAIPRDDVGLAVNPEHGRGQDQLHIHIECLGPEVYQILHASAARLNENWSSIRLAGRDYLALRVMGDDLGINNPFEILAQRLPGARPAMGAYTLLVAGMQFKDGPGFIVVTGRKVPGAELLLDSTCALAGRGQEPRARP